METRDGDRKFEWQTLGEGRGGSKSIIVDVSA